MTKNKSQRTIQLLSSIGLLLVAVAVGLVESAMARLRLLKVPQLLLGASALAALGLLLVLRG